MKLKTLLLSLLLTTSLIGTTYADERMNKDALLKHWDGKVITMINRWNKLVSFKVSNGEVFHIANKDRHNTDVWIRDNGKLCIEYNFSDDCRRVIKTSDGVFIFKIGKWSDTLTLSDNINEAMSASAISALPLPMEMWVLAKSAYKKDGSYNNYNYNWMKSEKYKGDESYNNYNTDWMTTNQPTDSDYKGEEINENPTNVTGDVNNNTNSKSPEEIKKAAEQGDSSAQNDLGLMYENGLGVTQDYKTAVKWYKKAAEQGEADAQNNLGVMYDSGLGVTQNYKVAAKWFKKAADQEYAVAQFNLGVMYANGFGVLKDYKAAVKWYKKSAEQGYVSAQSRLGFMYAVGKIVTQNYKVGFKWYKKAAEQGNAFSQYNLGVMYDSGLGVLKDVKKAAKWYKKSAEQGNVDAQYGLGYMYSFGSGITKDDKEAVKWYKKAAEQGKADAQTMLGVMYELGLGITKDEKEAVKWYKKAAEQGDDGGQYNLGVKYYTGTGTLTDPIQAIIWLRKAAEQGSAKAQLYLGMIYFSDDDVIKDLGKAKYWVEKAYKSNKAYIVRDAKTLWDDAELWKYKSKKDSGSFTINKTPKQNQKELYSSSGTGFRVNKKGMLITNYHVVKGCSDVKVNGNKVVVKSTDSRNDLALLQGSPSSLIPYFRAGRSVRLGEDIIVTGYPLRSIFGSGLNVTTGIVASLSGVGNNTSRIQITAPINSGNSGGPVFDNSGRIVGIVVSKIDTTKARKILGEDIQGANFAIKNSVVKNFLDVNNVDYEVSTSTKNRSTADIIEDAQGFTIFVKCWK